MATTAIIEVEGLDSLGALPARPDRVVLLFQCSPRRRALLAERFPGATLIDADPRAAGPWSARVGRDLERIAPDDLRFEGVPILDCFRAPWRDELSRLRSLEWALAGARRAAVVSGTPAAALLRSVADRGGIDALDEVGPGATGRAAARPSLLTRVRRVGLRGLMLALETRLDPSHVRRARWRTRPRIALAGAVLVSSYVNASRAALEAFEHMGGGDALFLTSGPRALTGLRLPSGVRDLSLSAAASLARREARAARATVVDAVRAHLDRVDDGGAWSAWPPIRGTALGRHLLAAHVPEVAVGIVGARALLERSGASRLLVGDEFSSVNRAAVHLARALGVETVSRQHGVLDGHYRDERILAHRHLAWDEASVGWLEEHGAVGQGTRVEVVARRHPALPPRTATPRSVAVFLQPLEIVGVCAADWYAEALPPILRAAAAAAAPVILKPHPLQTVASVRAAVPAEMLRSVTIVADRSARDLLAEARVAVTLESSVAADCRDAGVPCLSTGWYPGTYADDMGRLGYVERCPTPEALEERMRAMLSDTRAA